MPVAKLQKIQQNSTLNRKRQRKKTCIDIENVLFHLFEFNLTLFRYFNLMPVARVKIAKNSTTKFLTLTKTSKEENM